MIQETKIYSGAINELGFILKKLKFKRIFLVTGKVSYIKSGAKEKIDLIVNKYPTTIFSDFKINPTIEDIEKGIKIFNSTNCDIIVSIGGGSVIDMGKLINYFRNSTIRNFDLSNKKTDFKSIDHICIPTTAGSGSEATHFAVMYKEGIKYSIANKCLIPNYALIDIDLHYSQTRYQKVVSGVDALAQAIESYWSINSNLESKVYSLDAIKLIWEYLPKAVNRGDTFSHQNLAKGANLAGKAINISKTTGAHALSYAFTTLFGIPHGHSVILSLPYFFEYNYNVSEDDLNDERGIEYVQNTMLTICNQLGISNPFDARSILTQYFNRLGLRSNINLSHIKKSSTITQINRLINISRMNNNPRIVDITFINKILNKILI